MSSNQDFRTPAILNEEREKAPRTLQKELEQRNDILQPYNETSKEIQILATDETQRFVEENSNLPIFHVMKTEYFLKLIGYGEKENGENYLRKVSEWDDVNEGFFYRQTFHLAEGIPVQLAKWLDFAYGQSWSLNNELETCYMWEVYGKESKGDVVQITSTVGRLWNSILSFKTNESTSGIGHINARFGRVGYTPLRVFVSFMDKNIDHLTESQQLNNVALDSLFLKNAPFGFEREVRLILSLERTETIHSSNSLLSEKSPCGFTYCVDPKNILTHVVASPYMKPHQFEQLMNQMENSLLHSSKLLSKSNLFVDIDEDCGDWEVAKRVKELGLEVLRDFETIMKPGMEWIPSNLKISAMLLHESIKMLHVALESLGVNSQSYQPTSDNNVSVSEILRKIHKIQKIIERIPPTESRTSPIWASIAPIKAAFTTFDNAIIGTNPDVG